MIRSSFIPIVIITAFIISCGNNHDKQITYYHPETIRLVPEDDGPSLSLQIPDGYHIKRKVGNGFLLYYAVPVDTTGLASKATLGMYIGHYPNPVFPDGDSIIIADADVGARYKWKSWIRTEDNRQSIISDALDDSLLQGVMPESGFGGVRELQLHFFINATDRRITRLLMRSAESVRLVNVEE